MWLFIRPYQRRDQVCTQYRNEIPSQQFLDDRLDILITIGMFDDNGKPAFPMSRSSSS